MKAIVTGGAGFIGSHLVDALLLFGAKVIVIDDLSTGKMENISSLCEFYGPGNGGDICDFDSLSNIITSDIDVVYHVAALPRVQYSIASPLKTHKANVDGTVNVLKACVDANIKRVVISSSSSVYGNQSKLPLTENMKPNPLSPYALHKLIGEYYAKLFYDLYNLKTVVLRYFNVFGERQDPNSQYSCLIPRSINLLLEDKSPIIFGDGEQTRDFNYVDDVVWANMKAAETTKKKAFKGPINIGANKAYSVNKIISYLKDITQKNNIDPIYTDPVIEAKHTLASNKKAKKLLAWEQRVDFKEGLKKTVEYFKHIKGL